MPINRTIQAAEGDTLLDAAMGHGIDLPHECGGNCACTTCHVVIIAGMENLFLMEQVEAERLETAENRTPASRLACQAIMQGGDITVFLPFPQR